MKRKFKHPAPSQRELTGPRYWRSLDELAETPAFREQLAREFPEGSSLTEGVDRRIFLKIMAASFALGGLGLAGCRRPETKILPYGKSVEYIIPGLPLYYATAMSLRKSAIPLLAETHQGRPTKIEGNPTYTPLGGATSVFAQASVLDLYDPERAREHTKGSQVLDSTAVNDLLPKIRQQHSANGGRSLAFLADTSASPTRSRLVASIRKQFPQAIWAEYEPIQDEVPAEAISASFGRPVKPLYRFSKAKCIISLDSDFLQAEAGAPIYARDFSKGRRAEKPGDEMNRLYVAESGFTITGSMADHRLRVSSSHVQAFAAALAGKILCSSEFASLAAGLEDDTLAWIDECAKDLAAHAGKSLVLAGAHQTPAVHVIVNAINAKLGNLGKTVDYVALPEEATPASISDLAGVINAGAVDTLIVINGNPAYNAPADLNFPALLKKIPSVIRYGYHIDETSELAGVQLAATHYLESWGDARTVDGTIVAIQPMILPLFDGLMEVELLARLAGEAKTGAYEQVFATIGSITGGGQKSFNKFLHDGVLAGSEYKLVSVSFNPNAGSSVIGSTKSSVTVTEEQVEVRFAPDLKIDDGRFASNGWLQELPESITKLAWDNAILVSPRLAKRLGVVPDSVKLQVARKDLSENFNYKEIAYIAEITVGDRKISGPIHIQPGLANYTVIVPLGYGRKCAGHVGTDIGFSAYPLRTTGAMGFVTGAKITVSGERKSIATTQEHWSMEGRGIVREANLEEFDENPNFVKEIGIEAETPPILGPESAKRPDETEATYLARIHGGNPSLTQKFPPRGNSLYETPNFDGIHQWGMSIDLNTCIGCNTCVIACQAENNIPIVGREQVKRGREMHWIRLDRYYSDGRIDSEAFGAEGNREIPEDPQAVVQPMTCQHCELAPCETVCPVNATVHDDEGLNVMAYNRCIGTRYCANNCPYKVRRFNYFDWNKRATDDLYMGPLGHQKEMPELIKMVKNPDVTVRMRGVMEKCTYCVQRIQQAKIAQLRKAGPSGNVEVPDGTFTTACAQSCPTESIVFGNIKDPDSQVAKLKAQPRGYAVLGYLNVRPRTTYLGKLRNPNPKMPDYKKLPLSRVEQNKKNHPTHSDGAAEDYEAKAEKHETARAEKP